MPQHHDSNMNPDCYLQDTLRSPYPYPSSIVLHYTLPIQTLVLTSTPVPRHFGESTPLLKASDIQARKSRLIDITSEIQVPPLHGEGVTLDMAVEIPCGFGFCVSFAE